MSVSGSLGPSRSLRVQSAPGIPLARTGVLRLEVVLTVCAVVCYLLARLLLIPDRADLTSAFSHDSGYLARVTENLVAGKGFVIDSLWLVFLMPPSLPMPYHNANPLFPSLAALVSVTTGANAITSGFAISAVASVLLLVAIVVLIRPVVSSMRWSLGLAFAVVLFPPVLTDSFLYLTDGLCAALLITFVALLERAGTSSKRTVFAGAVLGLAWLTRGATILVVPALLVYLVLKYRPALAARRLCEVAVGAVLIASPWLVHTKLQWGSFLRSDSGYAMVQDLAAQRSHGSSVMRYWHSVSPPPPVMFFVRESPMAFARHVTAGTMAVGRRTAGWWSMHNAPVAGFMLACALLWCLSRKRLLTPQAAALTMFAATTFLVLGIRGPSFEERYVNVLTIFAVLFSALGGWQLWQLARTPGRRVLVGLAIAALWLVFVPVHAVQAYHAMYAENPSHRSYRATSAEVHQRFTRGAPVVVGLDPYFYGLETASVALNFPDASDEFLLRYMDKYHARHVFLTRAELEFWRPSWRSLSQLPPGLQLAGTVSNGFVFVRTDARVASASTPQIGSGKTP